MLGLAANIGMVPGDTPPFQFLHSDIPATVLAESHATRAAGFVLMLGDLAGDLVPVHLAILALDLGKFE